MMKIVNAIIDEHFLASPEQIEKLARIHTLALNHRENASATYLSVLIATTQHAVADRGLDPLEELERLHKIFYAAVLRGISATGTPKQEVQKKGTFARTAKSTLVAWMRAGGNIQLLIPGKVTKEQLRRETNLSPQRTTTEYVRRSASSIINIIRKVALDDMDEARHELQLALEMLNNELYKLNDKEIDDEDEYGEDDTVIVDHTLQRVDRGESRPSP